MTYDEAIAFWFGRINYEVRSAAPQDLKLERMRALLLRLGDPHDHLRIVHVTGTKGKGSTCAMLDAVLRAAGYRVGLFTSPHLEHVEERVRVNGEPITGAELVSRMSEIAQAVRALETGPWPPPTFFEISTALGFLHFRLRRCDVAIVEVGLGGRFDSTNVCNPVVSVITSVGLDHMAQLGTSPEAIAFQKAGIIKPRVPVVSGVTQDGPRNVIAQMAAENGCRVVQMGRDFSYSYQVSELAASVFSFLASHRGAHAPRSPMTLGLLGEHQAANAAVAVATLDVLRDAGFVVLDSAIARGLRDVRWPAHVELLSRRPAVILDTAHNVPSAEALISTLRLSVPVAGRKSVVFAVSSDKQVAEILRVLAGYFDRFHLTKYGTNPRCVPPEALAATLAGIAPSATMAVHPSAADAWRSAIAEASADDLVCVTGSVFLAGELRPLLPDPGFGLPMGNAVDTGVRR